MKKMQNEGVSTTTPEGMIYVVDPSPLNWLYILYNTMEESVRADHSGAIIPSLANYEWKSDTVLELKLKEGVTFHDGEPFTAQVVKKSVHELLRWLVPHPPGSFLNYFKPTTLKVIDSYTVQLYFPKPDGLAVAKLRATHFANFLFWNYLGFGYRKLGSAEGHW
ncbi:ABC transporter substrate-binding protein [Halobacillus amylolyticus]|uniref:ABC transporter substrate-binding protein n=1 Tax=Halobacillus amylolyticus TaxID=2932259 RepID=A0ABY4HF76_9BACI|nr:ABC transporter substrate-binding protein [Halobacillus amylolyticus]UOR12555.1 ABC transporter substrate-binding protein [Halobacillus amylolyticus]